MYYSSTGLLLTNGLQMFKIASLLVQRMQGESQKMEMRLAAVAVSKAHHECLTISIQCAFDT